MKKLLKRLFFGASLTGAIAANIYSLIGKQYGILISLFALLVFCLFGIYVIGKELIEELKEEDRKLFEAPPELDITETFYGHTHKIAN